MRPADRWPAGPPAVHALEDLAEPPGALADALGRLLRDEQAIEGWLPGRQRNGEARPEPPARREQRSRRLHRETAEGRVRQPGQQIGRGCPDLGPLVGPAALKQGFVLRSETGLEGAEHPGTIVGAGGFPGLLDHLPGRVRVHDAKRGDRVRRASGDVALECRG
jgi:hypothetical protein